MRALVEASREEDASRTATTPEAVFIGRSPPGDKSHDQTGNVNHSGRQCVFLTVGCTRLVGYYME